MDHNVRKTSLQKGGDIRTFGDIKILFNKTNFKPIINIDTGIKKFIEWYKEYSK